MLDGTPELIKAFKYALILIFLLILIDFIYQINISLRHLRDMSTCRCVECD